MSSNIRLEDSEHKSTLRLETIIYGGCHTHPCLVVPSVEMADSLVGGTAECDADATVCECKHNVLGCNYFDDARAALEERELILLVSRRVMGIVFVLQLKVSETLLHHQKIALMSKY